jgi:hypothetical protein
MPAVALLSAVFCPSNAPKCLGSSICAWIFVVASAELMLSTSRSSTCSGGTHASTSIWSQASGRLGPAVQLPILHRSPVHWNAKQRPVPFHRCPLGCGTFFLLSCPSKFIYHCLCIRAHQLLSFAAFPSQHLVIDPFVCTLSLFGALASTTHTLYHCCATLGLRIPAEHLRTLPHSTSGQRPQNCSYRTPRRAETSDWSERKCSIACTCRVRPRPTPK